jgi:hypothetical protein
MTSPLAASPLSVRDLLFEPGEDLMLDARLDDGQALGVVDEKIRVLGRVGREFVVEELTRAILEVVDSDVLALMGAAWRKHTKLVETARRTSTSPGAEEQVVLATHRMSSIQEPQVDVLVDGTLLGTLDLRVSVSFEVKGLVAIVREGRLIALRAGSSTAEAALAIEGIEIARRDMEFDLTSEISLASGIALVPRSAVDQP